MASPKATGLLMDKSLVIVESPAKARTIQKFLGQRFKIIACGGHVRDLPSKDGAVDVDNDFKPRYVLIPETKKYVEAIKKELPGSNAVYMATDLDREGEAIAWHLAVLLGLIDDSKEKIDKRLKRIIFHEITKEAIEAALKNPRGISSELVEAQQARRVLDYLVGFNLSPLLWKKVAPGLSAGRVQSVALRLICEREKEIKDFVLREYWGVLATLSADMGAPFKAALAEARGKKLEKFDIPDANSANQLVESIRGLQFKVGKVTAKDTRRTPPAPFITSTLQQEASRKLGFSAKKTMLIAQRLYEGVDIGPESIGLITYMRTDSVHLADSAMDEAREVIRAKYGPDYALKSPRKFKNKAKNVQEAHEAIRPTSFARTSEQLKAHLSQDEFKLYDLIWKRTIATQMAQAIIESVSVEINAGDGYIFRASGSTTKFPGYMRVYIEGLDDEAEEEKAPLPPLAQGQTLRLINLEGEQHFTEPPPRYTEASLVKALEERGIGRPSTYAAIIDTLQHRKYAKLSKKRFYPNFVGMVVNDFLLDHFATYVDYNFTSQMEDQLDQIAKGRARRQQMLETFWQPFNSLVKKNEKEVNKRDVVVKTSGEMCPKCGKPLLKRLGKNLRGFYGCSSYPECTYTRPLEEDELRRDEAAQAKVVDELCQKCGSKMVLRKGKKGEFLGCSAFPKCRYTKPYNVLIPCPSEGCSGLLKRKRAAKLKKYFYGCSNYPKCNFALWDMPVAKSCPQCGFAIMAQKFIKGAQSQHYCPKKGCGYKETAVKQAAEL